MTQKQFDTYRFSINTQVKVNGGDWHKVTEVNFGENRIGMENGYYLDISEIEEIKESQE